MTITITIKDDSSQAHLDAAIQQLRKKVQLDRRTIFTKHRKRILIAKHITALGKANKKQYTDALHLHSQNLCYQGKVLGHSHLLVASTLNSMGFILYNMKYLDLAISCFEEVMEIREKVYGKDSLTVANTAYVLGLALAETHQYCKAEIYFRQALETYDKRAEPYRCLVSTILHCLGGVLYKLGKLDESLECYEKVLKMRLKLVPLDISSVGRTLHALANVHCDRGDHETAEKYYLVALMVKQNIAQEITLPVVSILSSLGYLYRSKRQLSLAVTCFTLALKIGRRLPESDEKVAEVLKQLSLTYTEIGEIKNAKKCLSRAEMIENKGRKKCGIS